MQFSDLTIKNADGLLEKKSQFLTRADVSDRRVCYEYKSNYGDSLYVGTFGWVLNGYEPINANAEHELCCPKEKSGKWLKYSAKALLTSGQSLK